MKQEIIGKIENVSLKREGETNGRKWQMFSVKINGQEFTSFDWQFKNKIGQEGHFFYEEKITEKNGKQYVNKTLENLPKAKTAIELRIEALENRVNELERLGGTPNKDYDEEMVEADKKRNPEYENMNEDLPF